MTYQNLRDRLANGPAHSAISRRMMRREALQSAFRVMAKRFLLSVPDLTAQEKQYLYDLGRDEARTRHLNIERLIEFSARSLNASDRQTFAELVRANTMPDLPVPPVAEAIDQQIAATAAAAVAVREFERRPCPATREAAIAADLRKMDALRIELDALQRAQVA